MATTSGVDKTPVPQGADIPDGPGAFLALALRHTKMKGAGIGYVPTLAALNALNTDGDSFAGLMVYCGEDAITYRHNGSSFVKWSSGWISYTPTLTNIVLGTGGTNVSKYRYENGLIRVDFVWTFGSSGQTFPSGTPIGTLPVTSAALHHPRPVYDGSGTYYDLNVTNSYVVGIGPVASSTTQFRTLILGTNGLATAASTTVPFTWATGDVIEGSFVFEPA